METLPQYPRIVLATTVAFTKPRLFIEDPDSGDWFHYEVAYKWNQLQNPVEMSLVVKNG